MRFGKLSLTAAATACTFLAVRGYSDKHFSISSGVHKIPKLRVSMDRIVKETVGLRPFRPSGPGWIRIIGK